MIVRYKGESNPLALTKNMEYEVISIEIGTADSKWYRIVLEDDDDDGSGVPGYLYPAGDFEIVRDSQQEVKYLGEDIPLTLTYGKLYSVIAIENGPNIVYGEGEADWLRIITDLDDDYLFQLQENEDYVVIE